MMHRVGFAIVFLCLVFSAQAGVEKTAFQCGNQLCFRWWPQVAAPMGWTQDRDNSIYYNFNAFAPSGKSFSNAEAVMYANAVFKPRVPESKSLAEFIKRDLAGFRTGSAGLKIESAKGLRTSDGKTAESHWLKPTDPSAQWERVAYLEEGEYFLVFVLSARTEHGLSDANAAFEQFVGGYRE